MKKTTIKKYCDLIVRTGVNVQKSQGVFINASVDQYEFVTLLADAAYKAGAGIVTVDWSHQPLTVLDYRHRSVKNLSELLPWTEAKYKYDVEHLPCHIHILSDDPDGLKNVNYDKMAKSRKVLLPKIKPYREATDNKSQWTIAAVPNVKWAKKLFPGDTKNAAVEKLWDAIMKTCYVTDGNDPKAEWEKHNKNFMDHCGVLNSKNFDYLEYKSSNGTDLRVGLMEKSRWLGGASKTLSGIQYNPNMPTEEVFTSPKKGVAEGRLVATMPLSHNGRLVEDFEFTFKNGKVDSFKAGAGADVIEKLLAMDEGSSYLGEVALVSKTSPIRDCGILFLNTLFDENASCHFALGKGYSETIEGFENMTSAEHRAHGLNDSVSHVDFMVGADDLSITGYSDGKAFEVFKNGTWAF